MIEIDLKINSVTEAINLVRQAEKLESYADFMNGRMLVDAKSLLGVLSCEFSRPCKIIIMSDELRQDTENFMELIKEIIVKVEVKK